ncbi:T9SS C-terminal target domain-containing protein [Flavobacterium circumlabens]|uniref:Delta-60 repeat protein/predicted secreted protein (Por secretion system target) n=1 Tax=Flavobacterium circumlabens TaxID=2133765 RepID=A0A4Y7UIK2_9FLAO|nr:T9SS type A sorting domain-containing protein [Flavobacterium circumlabens]TCN61193.1 putative delta-60 repeat protein/predicted secreted protein (Por secretion system target) [Flavobacterium circumlabens]TEB46295.1 T9SS C-terminal target domain-containing protein [Flavobacterium circumlabens]
MKKTLLFLILFLPSLISFSQTIGDITQPFGVSPAFNTGGTVYTSIIQPDGKILVAGHFLTYLGLKQNYLIRLNADGSKDKLFEIGTGLNNSIQCIALQSDGKIIIGGAFTSYQGFDCNRLIRLNIDGSKDNSFDIGTGFDNIVNSIAIQTDGKILVGGNFNSYQDKSQRKIIRLNSDGTNDTSFNIETGFNVGVSAIFLQNDGKIILGGGFSKYKDITSNKIIRLDADGNYDSSFVTGEGFNGSVLSIAAQTDGKIVVGGSFTTYKRNTYNRLVRLDNKGTVSSGSLNTASGFDGTVFTIAIQNDGKILVGGDFSKKIRRFNSNLTIDNSFNVGESFVSEKLPNIVYGCTVYSIIIQENKNILVGGLYTSYNAFTQNSFTCLNPDGNRNTDFGIKIGFNHNIYAITKQADGKILLGGEFTSYNGIAQKYLVRLNPDGSKDSSFNIGTGFNNIVTTIAVQADGKILVGGKFSEYQGIEGFWYLTRLNSDGSADSSFKLPPRFGGASTYNTVNSIVVQPDGKIILGRSYGDTDSNYYLMRLNTDGSYDKSFATNFRVDLYTVGIKSVVLQPDGKILAGGDFFAYNGIKNKYLIRLNSDGSVDNSFNIGTGFDAQILSLALQSDGKIIVGGEFTTYQGISQRNLVRLNNDGTRDNSFDVASGFNYSDSKTPSKVITASIQPDGKILLGGFFSSYQGNNQNNFVCLNSDGTKDNSFAIGTGFNYSVNSILQQVNGELLLGGNFTTYKEDHRSAHLIGIKGNTYNLSNEEFIKENKQFSLWPNPANNILNINSLNENNYAVKVYDLRGKLIYSKENVNNSIDVSSFTSGMYLIKIETQNGETSQKFIKI